MEAQSVNPTSHPLTDISEDVPPVMFRHFESAMDVRILKERDLTLEMMMVNQYYLVD